MLFASFFWLLVIHALQKLRSWIRNLHEQPAPKASARWSLFNKKQILLSLITTPFNKSFPSGSERNPRYHCLLRGHRKHVIHFKRRRLCCHRGSKLLDFLPYLPTSLSGKGIRWLQDSIPITWQYGIFKIQKVTRDLGRLSLVRLSSKIMWPMVLNQELWNIFAKGSTLHLPHYLPLWSALHVVSYQCITTWELLL